MFFRRLGEVWGFLALSRMTGLKGVAGRVEPSTTARAEAPGHRRVQGYALAVRAARQARCGSAEVVRRPWVATDVDALCVFPWSIGNGRAWPTSMVGTGKQGPKS